MVAIIAVGTILIERVCPNQGNLIYLEYEEGRHKAQDLQIEKVACIFASYNSIEDSLSAFLFIVVHKMMIRLRSGGKNCVVKWGGCQAFRSY